ncbi:MAG: hypothetical protein AAF560_03385 [Acidobacteriota bacterium]
MRQKPIVNVLTLLGVCWLVVSLVAVDRALADDRYLLGQVGSAAAGPYVFLLFDTSGSMTWSPACSQSDTFDDIDPFDSMCTFECTLDSTQCSRICPDNGCVRYAIVDEDNPVTELEEIIVDNDDPEVTYVPATISPSSVSGQWFVSTFNTGFKGSNYYVDGNPRVASPLFTATYDPDITTAGTYQVYMSWAPSFFRGTNIMVDIQHDGGTDTVSIDQTSSVATGAGTEFDGWNLLGTYELSTTNGNVVLRNEASNFFVTADAVRWVRIEIPPCIETGYRCKQPICEAGDCYLELNGDDPRSKFFQAKEVLHEAVGNTEIVHFGFGHYEQDNPRLQSKHWYYRLRALDDGGSAYTPPTLGLSGPAFLEVGDEEVFGNYSTSSDPDPGVDAGDGWHCHTDDSFFVSGLENEQIGCNSSFPVDITDIWEAQRGHRIPKLGYAGAYNTDIWYRVDYDDNQIFRVRYSPNGDSFGDTIFSANVDVTSCPNGTCAASSVTSGPVYYDLVTDYAAWDSVTRRQPMVQSGFFYDQYNAFAGFASSEVLEASGCFGMEINDDTFFAVPDHEVDDTWWGYNIFWPTVQDSRGDDFDFDGVTDSPRSEIYDEGDFVPLDWEDPEGSIEAIQRRLVPNHLSAEDGSEELDYRVATYFVDEHGPLVSGNEGSDPAFPYSRRLRLKNDETDGDSNDDERPMIATGLTPLAESMNEFQDWYTEWSTYAPVADSEFACREKYMLIFTDGADACSFVSSGVRQGRCKVGNQFDESCDPADRFLFDPAAEAAELVTEDIDTWVVGFGVEDSELDAIAASGNGEVLLARNKEELQEALESFLTQIEAQQRVFASASIPAIQSTAADKIFLSSFTSMQFDPDATPANNPAPGFWPGLINAFRSPLPLDNNNQPDTSRSCIDPVTLSATFQSACHLWEAGDILCDQVVAGTRVVIHGMQRDIDPDGDLGTPRPIAGRLFEVPSYVTDNPTQLYSQLPAVARDAMDDLGEVLLDAPVLRAYRNDTIDNEFVSTQLNSIIDRTIGIKGIPPDQIGSVPACDLDASIPGDDSFVLGDIFHASPVALSGPSNFTYFATDQCGAAQRTDIPSNCVPPDTLDFGEDRGYRRFAADHVWRRRMLIVPANDGQLHFFDIGIRQVVDNDFTNTAGDTAEVFSDGSGKELFSYIPRMVMPVIKEQAEGTRHIFSMDGSVSVADVFIDPIATGGAVSTATDRNWRTVLIGGLREGGDLFRVPTTANNFKSGYYALDVTQPDIVNERTTATDLTLVPCQNAGCDENTTPPSEFSPSCMTFDADGNQASTASCPWRINNPPATLLPFPAELWSFTDSRLHADGEEPYFLDEDAAGENGHGFPDLADTWSKPVIGQVALCEVDGGLCAPGGADVVTKHVAIFGGGMDALNKTTGDAEKRGAYLYMIDVETGVPIYKRRLGDGDGSAPSDPAVLDTDRDGIFDVIYQGTTDGLVYKVDLTALSTGNVPALQDVNISISQMIQDLDGDGRTFTQATDTDVEFTTQRVIDDAWKPYPILDTGGIPIYFPPAAFFVPELNRYALAVGTGDREDLWSSASLSPESKFFVVVDDNFAQSDLSTDPTCTIQLPITESCLVSFSFLDEPLSDFNLLLEPPDQTAVFPAGIAVPTEQYRPGWVMSIPATQSTTLQSRATSEPFIVAGILVFSAYDPASISAIPAGGDDDDDDDDDDLVCERTGTTRAFVLQVENGGPVADLSPSGTSIPTGDDDDDDDLTAEDRFQEIEEFTTAPFIERTATKNNPEQSSGRTLLDAIDEATTDSVRQALLDHLPRGSRFNDAFQLVIAALRNSTGVEVYATVPIAMYPADWRDN